MSDKKNDSDFLHMCPICIDTFRIPRSTPCKHNFCEECLFTYVSTLKDKGELGTSFPCPACRQDVTAPPDGDVSLSWIQTFPMNEELALAKSEIPANKQDEKGDASVALCEPCLENGEQNRAVKFCIDCRELCKGCVDTHRKFKVFKDHKLIDSVKQGLTTQIKDIGVDIKCMKHRDRDVEIYCPSHDIYCCVTCATITHRDCVGILGIEDMERGANRTMASLKRNYQLTEKCLEQLRICHEGNMNSLLKRTQDIKRLFKQRKDEIIKTLNDLQGELESATKRLLTSKEQEMGSIMERIESTKLRCRQNIDKLDILGEYSLPAHKVVMQKEIIEEYKRLEKDMETDELDVEGLSVEWSQLDKLKDIHGMIVTCKNETLAVKKKPDDCLRYGNIMNQMKDKRFVRTEDHTVKPVTGCRPYYTGVTMEGNQQLVLCDNQSYDKACGHVCLYDTQSRSTSKLEMNKPFGVNILKSKSSHIAVSVPNDKQIHVVSRENNTLTTVNTFQTDKKPYSLICFDNGQLGVTWDNPPSFDIVDVGGKEMKTVKSYTQDSSGRKFKSFQYVAVDELRAHIIQPCTEGNAIYCFDYSGNPVFEYKDADLMDPRGVDTDRDGNIYICSRCTHSLHVLMPSGRKIKVIKEGVPVGPAPICFDETGESFWVTSGWVSEFCDKVYSFQCQEYR